MRYFSKAMLVASAAFYFSLSAAAQHISLKANNITVKDAIEQIRKKSGYSFVFSSSDVNTKKRISLSLTNAGIDEAVRQVLRGQPGIEYDLQGKTIIIRKDTSQSPPSPKQESVSSNQRSTHKITGRVLDEKGDPIIGASVKEVGTRNGAITDVDGNFAFLSTSDRPTLTISYVGYEEKTTVGHAGINIKMSENSQALNELVVIGFGTQRKSNITDAITTVDTKMLDSRPVTNLSQSLQGTVPGLNLSVGGYGGQLGQGMDVQIRGTGTISTGSKASTLVLIDGIEGNMDDVNPDDIESISVLKDAAASSVYGSRAAFGVILITTKRGHSGKMNVSYAGNIRYYGPNRLPDPMDSWQFANYFNEGSINGGGNAIFDDDTMNRIQQYMRGEIKTSTIANANGNWQFHEKANDNVNWYKTHYKWSLAQEHNVNINGGNEKNQYYLSTNYLNQDGNLRYGDDSFQRLSLNAKYNASPYKWLDVSFNTKYVYKNLDNPLYSDLSGLLYHDIVRMWPMMPFKDPNGYFMRNGKLIQLTNGSRSITSTNNVYLQGQLIFHPLKGWNIYTDIGLRMINQFQKQNLNKVYEHNVNGDPLELAYGASYTVGETGAMQYWTRGSHLTTNIYSDYSFAIKEHLLKFMFGFNAENYNNRVLSASRMGLITEQVPEIGGATGTDKISNASAYSWATAGFFGRINYDFNNKYFVAGNLRYDGSSRFLKKDRWGLFGSFSIGWNIAEENFFPINKNIISLLKPRLSWGTLGNQNTNSYYPFYLTQNVSPNSGDWLMDGIRPNVAYVPKTISSTLTWETIRSFDIGFDLSMLRNRLNINFDYYKRKTLNMVGPSKEIASIFGTSTPDSNNTDLHTTGWELALSWQDFIGDIHYNIGFNISDDRTYIDKYPNDSQSLTTYYTNQELGEIWGYVTHGIAKSQQEMDEWLNHNKPSWGSGWGEGDIMYQDLNGDGIINTGSNTLSDPGDRKIIGNSTPRYRFGFNLGLEWNGIDFSMFLQGTAKRDLWLSGPMFWGLNGGEWQSTGLKEQLDYYRPQNTTSVFGPNTDAYFPKIYLNDDKNQRTQTGYLRSGAYARLKNIQLGYNFQKELLQKIHLQKLYVYVSAENLLTITSLPKSFDPETAYSSYTADNSGKTYPLSMTLSLGLKVSF